MTDKMLPGFESPELVCANNFACTRQSITRLLGSANVVTYNLCFVKISNKIPEFGISVVDGPTLASLAAERFTSIDMLEVVRKHTWMGLDAQIWQNRKCDNNMPVTITIRRNAGDRQTIELIFSHDNVRSLIYSYRPDFSEMQLYFVMFVPRWEVSNKRIALLSNYDYYMEIIAGVEKKVAQKKFKPSECISCCSRLADIVFIPCGHLSFCRACADEYRKSECPICKQTVTEHKTCMHAAKFCIVCPSIFDCQEVNAMLLPCCCVVGCVETTRLAIQPGEPCVNCERDVERIQLVYN